MMKMLKAKKKALEELMDHMRKIEGSEEDEESNELVGPDNPSGKMEMEKSLSMIGKEPSNEEDEMEEEDMDEEEDVPLSEREEFMRERKAYMQRGISGPPRKAGKTKAIMMSLKVMPKGKIAAKK